MALVPGDADLALAVPGVARGIFANAGQVRVGGSRVHAHRSVFEALTEGLAAASIRLGPAIDPASDLGPLVNAAHAGRVAGFLAEARAEEAEMLAGGQVEHASHRPMAVVGTAEGSRPMTEEIPVRWFRSPPFDEIEEAIAGTNATDPGGAASVWTESLSAAHRTAAAIRAGTASINCHGDFSPDLPRGDPKQSGWGIGNGAERLGSDLETRTDCLLLLIAADRDLRAGQPGIRATGPGGGPSGPPRDQRCAPSRVRNPGDRPCRALRPGRPNGPGPDEDPPGPGGHFPPGTLSVGR